MVNLVAQIAFGLLAMTICLPSMQEWGQLLGTDQASVQLTFSAFVLTYGCLQLVYGPLSDRHGRKTVLLVGLAMALAGSVVGALSHSLGGLLVARVMQGAGAAAGAVVGRAAVQDLFHGPEKTRVMAFVGMAMGLCPPSATLIGGTLHVAWGWQSNFVLIAGLAVVLMAAAWWGLPDIRPSHPPSADGWWRTMLRPYPQLVRAPGFLAHVAILALTVAAFYAFLSGAPVVLRSYGVGPAGVGWHVMVPPISYIVGNFLTTRLIHVRGERWLMVAGQLATLCGIGLVLVLGLAGVASALAFSLPLILFGMGHGLLVPPCMARTVGLVPALAGTAAAMAGLGQQLAGATAGYMVGWFSHDGSVNLAMLMMGFTLAACAVQAWLYRSQRSAALRSEA